MKTAIVVLFVVFFGLGVYGGTESVPTSGSEMTRPLNSSDDWLKRIVTSDGSVYDDCRLLKVEPNGILIEYTPRQGGMGLAKIKFSALDPAVQKQFHYNHAAALEFERLQAKSNFEHAQQISQQQELANQLAREDQKQADTVWLAEERERLEDQRVAAVMAHEEKLAEQEAYARREVARWQSPDVIVYSDHGSRSRHESHGGRTFRRGFTADK